MRERKQEHILTTYVLVHYSISLLAVVPFLTVPNLSIKPLINTHAEHVLGTCLLWAGRLLCVFSRVHPWCWGALVKQANITFLEI